MSLHTGPVSAVVLLYVLLGTIGTLVAVLAASALLYRHWIEIVLLYRTYQSKDETLGGKFTSTCSPLTFPLGIDLEQDNRKYHHYPLALFPQSYLRKEFQMSPASQGRA